MVENNPWNGNWCMHVHNNNWCKLRQPVSTWHSATRCQCAATSSMQQQVILSTKANSQYEWQWAAACHWAQHCSCSYSLEQMNLALVISSCKHLASMRYAKSSHRALGEEHFLLHLLWFLAIKLTTSQHSLTTANSHVSSRHNHTQHRHQSCTIWQLHTMTIAQVLPENDHTTTLSHGQLHWTTTQCQDCVTWHRSAVSCDLETANKWRHFGGALKRLHHTHKEPVWLSIPATYPLAASETAPCPAISQTHGKLLLSKKDKRAEARAASKAAWNRGWRDNK